MFQQKQIMQHLLLIFPPLIYFSMCWSHFMTSPAVVTSVFALLFSAWQFAVLKFVRSSTLTDTFTVGTQQKSTVKNIVVFIVTVYAMCHTTCVLLGAPLVDDIIETSSWALMMTGFISVPSIMLLGCDMDVCLQVILCGKINEDSRHRFVYVQTLGVIVGSYLSVFAIPLDWDRPWQKWPIPLVAGAVLGYCASLIYDAVTNFRPVSKYR